MFLKIKKFLTVDLWNIRLKTLSPVKACLLQVLRVLVLTIRFFIRNKCTLYAASQTYYTILAIVPVLALVFGVVKGYGYDQILKEKLIDSMRGNETVIERIITFADSAISNASGGLVAGIGVLLLLWSAIRLLSEIEISFNRIWGIKKNRSWSRKFCDYLTMLLICPFLFVVVASSSSFVLTHLNGLAGNMPYPQTWVSIVQCVMKSIHLFSAWFIFFFLYIFMPNTNVKFKAAAISGFVIGVGYLILQTGYVVVQSKLTSYNAIYGSFAALPFFLIWLDVSWTMINFGAQLSFAIQYVNFYEMVPNNGLIPISGRQRHICAILLTDRLAKAFRQHQPPLTAADLSGKFQIPIRTTRAILYDLCEAGILSTIVSGKDEDDSYQLALPPDDLTPIIVLKKLDEIGAYFVMPKEISKDAAVLLDTLWNNAAPALNRPMGMQKN